MSSIAFSSGLRRRACIAAACGLFLSACGGGGGIEEAAGCSLLNCKESATLQVTDISPRYLVTQSGTNRVRVEARLGQSANLLTTVRPSGSDRLSASVGSQRADLGDTDGKRMAFAAEFSESAAQPSVTVMFHRGGETHVSTVTLPAAFSVTAPAGTSYLARSAGKLLVNLSLAKPAQAGASAHVVCQRIDGSFFENKTVTLPSSYDAQAGALGQYRIDTLTLDAALNEASRLANNSNINTPLVAACEMDVSWIHGVQGQLAAGMNRHGSIQAQRTARHRVNYDARL